MGQFRLLKYSIEVQYEECMRYWDLWDDTLSSVICQCIQGVRFVSIYTLHTSNATVKIYLNFSFQQMNEMHVY